MNIVSVGQRFLTPTERTGLFEPTHVRPSRKVPALLCKAVPAPGADEAPAKAVAYNGGNDFNVGSYFIPRATGSVIVRA